jgi:hypothetical protein
MLRNPKNGVPWRRALRETARYTGCDNKARSFAFGLGNDIGYLP